MQLTKEQLLDKIFSLQMELKEQQSMLSTLNSYNFEDDLEVWARNNLELEIQETICYISYYKEELQDLEDLKYE